MKTLNILIFLLLVVVLSSCKNNYLDLVPEDQPSGATFYQTEEQFRQALTAAYTPLRDLLVNDFCTAEMRSDNTHYEFLSNNRGTAYVFRENIADFLDEPRNAYVNAVYFHCYKSISRANIVLDRIGSVNLDEGVRNDIEGQAKFLRAFNYFKLVRYFGGVPLFLHEVIKADDAFLPRSTAEDVYQQIISDAQSAIDQLSIPDKFPQSGLATKGAATMLLAEVYMTQKKYAEAAAQLNSLTTMGYDLLPNYADVFSTANKNSKESIFEVQYQQGLQGEQQSNFIYSFLPRCLNTGLITYGIETNNTSTGGWNTPTSDIIAAYEVGDKRKDASIGIAEGSYNASLNFQLSAYKSIENYQAATGKVGVPFIKKFLNPHIDKNNTDDNWPIYRYADALLLLAEAQNELGNTAGALEYLNKVRTRAGLTAITETNSSALRDIIWHERRVELAFENHRWHDLVRTEQALPVMQHYGLEIKKQYSYLLPSSYQVQEFRLLYPIPQSERELNPALTQNPGYN